MGLRELERIRLILRGGSVIDWRRMHFQTRDEVDRFLRLCQIDTRRPHDEVWARTVLADAVEYLRRTFNYRVADAVASPEEIHDLFLYASGVKGLPRHRRIACIVLKVMHVLQHIEGRDLMHRLAVSEADLSELVTSHVLRVARLLEGKGLHVVEFAHSIKTRESLITKLLAKKETVAAQIYDRTRFRIITKTRADLLPVLYFLTQHLFPFNFVVPGQTENTLVSFKAVLDENPHLHQYAQQLHLDLDYEDREDRLRNNLFSGNNYRALNSPDGCLPSPTGGGHARAQEPHSLHARGVPDHGRGDGSPERGRGERPQALQAAAEAACVAPPLPGPCRSKAARLKLHAATASEPLTAGPCCVGRGDKASAVQLLYRRT
jgi:uncharacterized protein (TIGR04552 family)